MELLDRYLEAVRKHLPWQRQDDIVAELRANLEAQLEEKEATLGRPLTQSESEAWIKSLSSPMQMAAPYQPQQYLIGPALFPTYRYVLKLACSWGMIIYSIATVVTIFAGHNPRGSDLLWAFLRLPNVLLIIAAWITLVFAAFEFAVAHGALPASGCGPVSKNWSGNLPPLDLPAAGGKKPKSFAQAVTEAIFGVFALGWLLLIPQHPWLILGPGAAFLRSSPYQMSPVWIQFYWCLVAINIFQLGWNIACLQRGRWRHPQRLKAIIEKALSVFACLFLLSANDRLLILLKHPSLDQARYGTNLQAINQYVYLSLVVVTAIAAVQLAWDLGRLLLDSHRKRVAAQ